MQSIEDVISLMRRTGAPCLSLASQHEIKAAGCPAGAPLWDIAGQGCDCVLQHLWLQIRFSGSCKVISLAFTGRVHSASSPTARMMSGTRSHVQLQVLLFSVAALLLKARESQSTSEEGPSARSLSLS